MFRNYLTVALRNLLRYKVYSAINISGLAIGMACCILIFLFVEHELSYDTFHNHEQQIYRITTDVPYQNGIDHLAITWGPVGPLLVKDFPEVIQAVRFFHYFPKALLSYEEKHFYESRFFFVEPTVFEVFTFPLLKGDAHTALNDPNAVVITEEMAEKYFGDKDPIGKILTSNPTLRVSV
jgi:putative ABC transport system permease protein